MQQTTFISSVQLLWDNQEERSTRMDGIGGGKGGISFCKNYYHSTAPSQQHSPLKTTLDKLMQLTILQHDHKWQQQEAHMSEMRDCFMLHMQQQQQFAAAAQERFQQVMKMRRMELNAALCKSKENRAQQQHMQLD